MAEHGIEGAELREINRLAGQRNTSAVHYHFKDRQGLIVAMRDKHRPPIDEHLGRMVDEAVADGGGSIRSLVAAYVAAYAPSLGTASGRDFLIVLADAVSRTTTSALMPTDLPYTDGFNRLTASLLERVTGDEDRRRALVGAAILTVPALLADVARDIKAERITLAQSRARTDAIVDYTAAGLSG